MRPHSQPHISRRSSRRSLKVAGALIVAAAFLFVSACGGSDDSSATTTTAASTLKGTITVPSAASLTEAFGAIGKDFTKANPDAKVMFSFDSSTTLSAQIIAGAPADAFASADEANMKKLTDANLVDGTPEVFARNQAVIVTKPGNPTKIKSVADLATAATNGGVISLCGADVPCGKVATQVLQQAGVQIPETSITRGQNAKTTLSAVSDGDAVAGIVYVTDAKAAGKAVDTVEIPDEDNAIAVYPIGVLKASGNPTVAKAFEDFVLGDSGQATLEEFGFLPPT